MCSLSHETSGQKREHEKRIRIEAGSLTELAGLFHIFARAYPVATVEMNRREAVVAGQDELRLPSLLGQCERLAICLLRLLKCAATLVDLRDHDERHSEVIQLSELAIEIGSRPRRLQALRVAPLRERTVCRRQVRIDVRLKRLVSLVISAALAGAAALFHGPEQALLSRVLELVVSLLVLTFVFALFYKYVPDAAIGWRDVWLGGLLTAVLFTLGKTAIGVYLGQASVGSAYGAAGSMVVLLVWVYYSALIMFFGAEFTQAWATRHGGVAPQPHAISGAAPQTKSEAATDRPPRS